MSAPAFTLPAAREAHEPAEVRGLGRDDVRLMVATRHEGDVEHLRFPDLPRLLRAGDVLVVNTSATLPAALDARLADGTPVALHVASPAPHLPPTRWWLVELRSAGGRLPLPGAASGDEGRTLTLADGLSVELVAPFAGGARLWLAQLGNEVSLVDYLLRYGRPIRYSYVPERWALERYQTAFAAHPGSAEMPSAGRPFTPELVTDLVAQGIQIAPLTLHTGVSSAERHERPYPERFRVPATTADVVNTARARGDRVIAVGTTVVRALETVADEDGIVHPDEGWTGLTISPERGVRAIDGLITGWHEPRASHLDLLAAVAGAELLARSYAEALAHGYLWHEFGDSHLVLP